MSQIDRLGEDREWNPVRNRGAGRVWEMGEERAKGGSTKRIGSGRILQQCLIFYIGNKEQGGSQKQNKK